MTKLEKFLAMIGMSSERYEKLSAAEQTQLTTLSDSLATAEAGQIQAEADRDLANEVVVDLNNQLRESLSLNTEMVATIEAHEATIATQTETITAHAATIAELRAELDKTPGATETKVVKGAETIPGQKTRPKRSWEVD